MAASARSFRRVLVANRGEIAVRVIRTLRDLGMTSIAVYSEADRAALHVLLADEAYPVGPAAASQSYLDVERLLEAARVSRAEAVHPGYGFLSENAGFAAACESAGLVFIGPPASAIRVMGNKLAARELARQVGAPLVPGSPGPVTSLDQARTEAERIGFPILLKAAAGGGGKGMRVLRDAAGLQAAFDLVRGEAKAAFGDDQVYVERYLEHPRHIEAQVLADTSGHVLFLGERECSVQRRHQKVLEETPSPALPAKVRAELGAAACKVAQAAGYRNAGTVEFIVDEKDRFYFLEMNTRLQVEHPVTEMVTGLDLVAEQIRIARGEPLGFDPQDAMPRGAAVECRVYAEDPRRGFLPATGTVARLRWPLGPGVRVDSGIYRGYTVPVHYDPILAKIVSWGRDREQALARMGRALDETILHGVTTNVGFHRWLVRHPVILAGRYDTRFLEEQFRPDVLEGDSDAERAALVAASLHEWQKSRSVALPRRRDGAAWKWAGIEEPR
ncbi:MAG TPA: acetyl-CoA carboxylase biotin carboxylase subunit [Candidatus Eisenbacteria bacterium]|nr:acetyl-CoA carboxylase biotin carboxylase subunit [Candidatus Eisenbacteria bacterium]